MGADISVALACPDESCGLHFIKTDAVQPTFTLRPELSSADVGHQLIGKLPGRVVGRSSNAAHNLLGDAGVPDVVKVQKLAVKLDMDAVAAPCYVFRMQRLVHVSYKVDDEFCGLLVLLGQQQAICVDQPRGIVLQRRDDAAFALAVALHDHITAGRRIILGVDEVEGAGEAAPSRVPYVVCPGGHVGQVVGRVVPKKRLEVGGCPVVDKAAGDVGDRNVPKA